MALTFLLIDRRDEYQLVSFIVLEAGPEPEHAHASTPLRYPRTSLSQPRLRSSWASPTLGARLPTRLRTPGAQVLAKLIQFLGCLYPFVRLWLFVLGCLDGLHREGDGYGGAAACTSYLRDQQSPSSIVYAAAEWVNILCVWAAFVLLLRGERHGGPSQIHTIEQAPCVHASTPPARALLCSRLCVFTPLCSQIRLDLADGELDGQFDKRKVKHFKKAFGGRAPVVTTHVSVFQHCQ